MLLTRWLIFSALFPLNCQLGKAQKEDEKVKMRKKDFLKLLQFADVPDFDVEFIYEETFSPDGIANQVPPFFKKKPQIKN
jgi:hypothetical protein